MKAQAFWVIRSLTEKDDEGESLYWSNEWGWVSHDSGMVSLFDTPFNNQMVGQTEWECW